MRVYDERKLQIIAALYNEVQQALDCLHDVGHGVETHFTANSEVDETQCDMESALLHVKDAFKAAKAANEYIATAMAAMITGTRKPIS